MIRPFFLLRRSWKTWTWDWRYYGLCTFANSSVMERGRVSGFVEERVARLYCCFRSNFKPQKGLCRWVKGFMSQCGANVFFLPHKLYQKIVRHCAIYTPIFCCHGLGRNAKLEATKEAVLPETKTPLPLYFWCLNHLVVKMMRTDTMKAKTLSSDRDKKRYRESWTSPVANRSKINVENMLQNHSIGGFHS